MKSGYSEIKGLSPEANEIIRKAFNTPETTYITTKEPNTDNLALGEMRIYNDGTNRWIYCRTSKTDIEKVLFDADSGTWTDYSTTSTITGWSSFTLKQIYYEKKSTTVRFAYTIEGVSDSVITEFTLPYASASIVTIVNPYNAKDNGVIVPTPFMQLNNTSLTVKFYKDMNGTVWTASGTKGIYGQGFYKTS